MTVELEAGSFRDRAGFIFYKDGKTYRAIHTSYQTTFEKFLHSALYSELVKDNNLIAFGQELNKSPFKDSANIYKIFEVPSLSFVSYPNEWTFAELKRAALLTLHIQRKALENNFSLKDATAYNVQFIGRKAQFIDSLSFEEYIEGEPWLAYKQFCQHFLAPLLLAHYGYPELKTLLQNYLDGLPLSLVSKLLPFRSKFNLLASTHIHLHARLENKHAGDKEFKSSKLKISKQRLLSLLEHLEQGIRGMKQKESETNWSHYYATCSYSEKGIIIKKDFVKQHCLALKNNLCIDLGANSGEFSAIASEYFKQVVACDNDQAVLREIEKKKIKNLLCLQVDLNNPTPAFGWNGTERKSFIERSQHNDLTLALALIHHLCIGNNVPLKKLAQFFSDISKNLILEFVPKNDVQVKKLLVTKKDIFDDYSLANFKSAFAEYFNIEAELAIPDSERILFLLTRKSKDA